MATNRKRRKRKILLYHNHGIKIFISVGNEIKNFAINTGKDFLYQFMESRWCHKRLTEFGKRAPGFLGTDMHTFYPRNGRIPTGLLTAAKSLTTAVIYQTNAYLRLKDKIAKKKMKRVHKAILEQKRNARISKKNTGHHLPVSS